MLKILAITLIALAIYGFTSVDASPRKRRSLEEKVFDKRRMEDPSSMHRGFEKTFFQKKSKAEGHLESLAKILASHPETRELVEELLEEKKEEGSGSGDNDQGQSDQGQNDQGQNDQELLSWIQYIYGNNRTEIKDFFPFCENKDEKYTELLCASQTGWWFCRERCLAFYISNTDLTKCENKWNDDQCQTAVAKGLCGMFNDESANCAASCFHYRWHRSCNEHDYWYMEPISFFF